MIFKKLWFQKTMNIIKNSGAKLYALDIYIYSLIQVNTSKIHFKSQDWDGNHSIFASLYLLFNQLQEIQKLLTNIEKEHSKSKEDSKKKIKISHAYF